MHGQGVGLLERAMGECRQEFLHVAVRWTETKDRRFLERMELWAIQRRIDCLEAGRMREARDYGYLIRVTKAALGARELEYCLMVA